MPQEESEIQELFSGEWPDTDLEKALKELYKERRESGNPLLGEDHIWLDLNQAKPLITPRAKQQLDDFAPDVRLIGPGMWSERYGGRFFTLGRSRSWRPWGGAFARVVESMKDENRRCLQYMYVYTGQRGVTSLFWMVALPLLLYFWGQLLMTIFTGPLLLLAAFLTTFPLLRMSVMIHWNDRKNPEGARFILRSTTWSIAYCAMLYLFAMNLLVLELLLWAAIGFFIVWLIEIVFSRILPQTHDMDYVPVLIWIRKTNGAWDYEKLCWDVFHYHSEPLINTELKKPVAKEIEIKRVGAMQRRLGKDWEQMRTIYTVNPEQKAWVQTIRDTVQQKSPPITLERADAPALIGLEDAPKPRRFRLEIPDPWHAMELEKQSKENYLVLGLIGCIVSTILLVPFLLGLFEPLFGPDPGIVINAFFYIIPPLIFVQSGLGIVRARFSLLRSNEKHLDLTDNKLRIMWNLNEEPRLKIVTKLQDPFNDAAFPEDGFSFNDDPYHLYSLIPNQRKRDLPFR